MGRGRYSPIYPRALRIIAVIIARAAGDRAARHSTSRLPQGCHCLTSAPFSFPAFTSFPAVSSFILPRSRPAAEQDRNLSCPQFTAQLQFARDLSIKSSHDSPSWRPLATGASITRTGLGQADALKLQGSEAEEAAGNTLH